MVIQWISSLRSRRRIERSLPFVFNIVLIDILVLCGLMPRLTEALPI